MRRLAKLGWFVWLLAWVVAPAASAGDEPADIEFFERKIRPVLVEHCYSCHSSRGEEGSRRPPARHAATACSRGATPGRRRPGQAGGEPAARGAPARRARDAARGQAAGRGRRRLRDVGRRWAPRTRASGAAAPAAGRASTSRPGASSGPSSRPDATAVPAVKDAGWPTDDIDRFVLAGLEAKGLQPAADADRATLARRLYFDLIGLPPTPEEVDAFVADTTPDAYETLVDRLLASPHFGERWGRHWLDVARFAESLTLRGFVLKEAWRYRDYVIDAFNDDLPFDRFIREQIAGDLLPAATPRRAPAAADRHDVPGPRQHQPRGAGQEAAPHGRGRRAARHDRQGASWPRRSPAPAATTTSSTRSRPRDYYALAGILRNAKTLEHANVSKWIEVPLPVEPERGGGAPEARGGGRRPGGPHQGGTRGARLVGEGLGRAAG